MDTQNTPVHIKLWHHDFWRLCFANLLLMMSVYMLVPAIPYELYAQGYQPVQVASVVGSYGLGIFVLGAFCSYLVQRYRRNRVCQYSIAAIVVCLLALYYVHFVLGRELEYWILLVARFVLGAFLGLAQMTLASTLIIDTCESFQRTEANYITSWFSRIAIAVGPMIAVLALHLFGEQAVVLIASICALASLILVSLVKFPFKAPSEHMHKLSLDRFFLPQGLPLFVNIVMIMAVVGLVLSVPHSSDFFLMVTAGMALGFLAEKYAFADADLKSEVITGLVLLGASLLNLTSSNDAAIAFVSPTLLGFALGIMGSRFLLFYIKLAKHCQRGTSMSSFFLAWEFGLTLGLYGGFLLQDKPIDSVLRADMMPLLNVATPLIICAGVALTVVSLLAYNFLVHPWYMKHRNR